jgi:hypothetical protein
LHFRYGINGNKLAGQLSIKKHGLLERLLVFVFAATNHWEGVGFLVAAKSIFRFGDLTNAHDRKLTEYILIGTMLSFGIATLAAILYVWANG